MSLLRKIATTYEDCGMFAVDCNPPNGYHCSNILYTELSDGTYMSCKENLNEKCMPSNNCQKIFKPVDQEVIQAVSDVSGVCGANVTGAEDYQLNYYFRFLYSNEEVEYKSIGGKQKDHSEAYKAEKVEFPHLASMTCKRRPNAGYDDDCEYENPLSEYSLLQHLHDGANYYIEVSVGNTYDASVDEKDRDCNLVDGICEEFCEDNWNINNPVYDPQDPTPIVDGGLDSYAFPIQFAGFCEQYHDKTVF